MKMKLIFLLLLGTLYFNNLKSQSQPFSDYASELRRTERYATGCADTTGKPVYFQHFNQYDYSNMPVDFRPYTGRTLRGAEGNCAASFWYSSRMSYQWNFSGINKNAVVTSVRIELWYTSATDEANTTDISVKICPLANEQWNATPDNRWSAIKNAQPYYSFLLPVPQKLYTPWSPIDFPSNSTICKDVENAIKAGTKFCIALWASDDEDWSPGTGSYRYTELLQEIHRNMGIKLTVNYYIPFQVTVVNSFGSGLINVDGNPNIPSGTTFNWKSTDSPPHKLLAYIQDDATSHYVPMNTWTNTTINNQINGNPITITDWSNATYRANYTVQPLWYSVTVKNSYNDGFIIVDGTTYASGSLFNWKNGSTHTLQAFDNQTYQAQNDLTYTMHFINWSLPTGSSLPYNPLNNVYASTSGTYTANIEGVCISGGISLGFKEHAIYTANIAGGSGSYTYQWYKQGGAVLGGTASTQNFTMINSDIPISVNVYDNVTGASLSADYTIRYDSDPFEKRAITQAAKPTAYSLSNNPNPFNPSTIINYQLPAMSNVKLFVYDMLGKDVATLVDGIKEAGYYTATFNASRLPSGIYFARFTAIPQDGSKPVSRTMKMLLAK